MSADAQDITSLLQQRAAGQDSSASVGDMLSARAQGHYAPPTPAPVAPVSRIEKFATGLTDLPTGLGQIMEHDAETPLNWIRRGIKKGLNAVGADEAAQLFNDVSTKDFDGIVAKREQDYQQARQQAGETGIDWWRLGGSVADPLNYLGPGGAAKTLLGRIGQGAAQGAAVSVAQPSTTPGNFWWDKAKGALVGGVIGGAASSVIEGVMPLLRAGVAAARKAFGGAAAASTPAADAVVNSALNAKGVDPNGINVNVLAGLKKEAQSALEHEAEPSAEAIANRAVAESLPVPVHLLRGQATGDAAAFSAEQNLRGITGVGEPLTQRLTEQNSAFVQNLDVLGAKNAPDVVETGHAIGQGVQNMWDALQAKKDALYKAVRNSAGQPAMMDQFSAAQKIREALDSPQGMHAYDSLPTHIQRTIEDLEDGKLPLTVAQMESLDKAWGADARAAEGSVANAINTARRILGEAPIQDDLGKEARAAYQAARQAHAQQMALVEPKLLNGMPNPNFQPLVKAVVMDGKAPETLFKDHFLGAAPSVAAKNLKFLQGIDPNAPEAIGRTLMGEIKRTALNDASAERGVVSQSVLSKWANDPVKSARLDALLPKPAADTFRALASTVEKAKRVPVASTVNTSNTGSTVVNAGVSMLKQNAAAQLARRLPGVKAIADANAAAARETAVQGALKPGVTVKSLMSASPSQATRRALLGRSVIPSAVAATSATDE